MATHYSEMDFLFSSPTNKEKVIRETDNLRNEYSIFDTDGSKYVVYKSKDGSGAGTNNIKAFLKTSVYKNEDKSINPYIQLLNDFGETEGAPGAGLRIKAADLVYLRELGVYPINRMAILRRFPEGCFVPEDLNEMKIEPISTVVGWIKPSDNFTKIDFNETWTTTDRRFDQVLSDIIKKAMGGNEGTPLVPIPDFAQGMLFELYKRADLLDRSNVDETVDETYENFNAVKNNTNAGKPTTWGLNNIPIGDPNVLHQGPFRDPENQNIQSEFEFTLETTYEQKLLGDIDPGSAMLDILDNLYTMGTSNMKFYWGDNAPAISKARTAASGKGNNLNAWWDMVADVLKGFWKVITDLFIETYETLRSNLKDAVDTTAKTENESKTTSDEKQKQQNIISNKDATAEEKTAAEEKLKTLEKDGINNKIEAAKNDIDKKVNNAIKALEPILQSILTSTISINRFKLRGSLELMVGGKMSSTPWYLTLGNPYSPWFATNHIIVYKATVETSNEMGFNDQPQRLTATFNCKFSRPLGKQELMRMFNNTFRRTYSTPPPATEAIKSTRIVNSKDSETLQSAPIPIGGIAVSNQKSKLMGNKNVPTKDTTDPTYYA